MKKFYYLVASMAFVLVVIMACEKSTIGVDEFQTLSKEEVSLSKEEVLLSKSDDKVTICHWDAEEGMWYQITIAQEAVDKHFANHGDKFPYSSKGVYTIYRDNGAVLNITILADGTISGSGYTSNGASDPQTYTGTATVDVDHTVLLVILQQPQGGTHRIEGIVSECGGITELTNDYSL